MQNESLFSEFEPVSAKQWKQKIQFDLKGADYNDTLVWESLEGIKVKPFYTADDLETIPRFSMSKNHEWRIAQSIYAGNEQLANNKAQDVLNRGAQSLIFQVPNAKIDWKSLLDGIDLERIPLHFHFDVLDVDSILHFKKYTFKKKSPAFFHIDVLGNLARSGNWFYNEQKDHQLLAEILDSSKNNEDFHVLGFDTSLYQNAGANMVQQLAYGLAHAHEYLNTSLIGSSAVEKSMSFKVAVGTNYFFEIAKIRALRWLWQTLTAEYHLKTDCHIMAVPSKRNKTLYDYNVNMLRTTSECMSAVLGGADTICNLSYDAVFHKDNEFGERIARNQLLLLKEESYFDEAVHAANSNYYIETLTHQLAEKALVLFKQIEASGGFLKQLKQGTIQRKIKENAAKEQKLFDNGQLVLLGTNKFQNKADKMKGELQLHPFVKTDKRKTEIEPIIEKRLAGDLEQKRLKNENIA